VGFLSAEAAQERISAALDAIDAAHDVLRDASSDLVGNNYRVNVAERLETQDRVNRGLMYRFFGEIAAPPDGTGFVPVVRDMLWARLRITPQEITRRSKGSADLTAWSQRTGPPAAGYWSWTRSKPVTPGKDHGLRRKQMPACVSLNMAEAECRGRADQSRRRGPPRAQRIAETTPSPFPTQRLAPPPRTRRAQQEPDLHVPAVDS
jgi:hypothetical protein